MAVAMTALRSLTVRARRYVGVRSFGDTATGARALIKLVILFGTFGSPAARKAALVMLHKLPADAIPDGLSALAELVRRREGRARGPRCYHSGLTPSGDDEAWLGRGAAP